MRQGTASSIPEIWMKYPSVDEARASAKHMYHDDRVLRVSLWSMEPARSSSGLNPRVCSVRRWLVKLCERFKTSVGLSS